MVKEMKRGSEEGGEGYIREWRARGSMGGGRCEPAMFQEGCLVSVDRA